MIKIIEHLEEFIGVWIKYDLNILWLLGLILYFCVIYMVSGINRDDA